MKSRKRRLEELIMQLLKAYDASEHGNFEVALERLRRAVRNVQ